MGQICPRCSGLLICSSRSPIRLDPWTPVSPASVLYTLPEPWLHFLSSGYVVAKCLAYVIELIKWIYYCSISQKRKLWLREVYSKLLKNTQLESAGAGFQLLADAAVPSVAWAAQRGVLGLELKRHWSPGQNRGLRDRGSRPLWLPPADPYLSQDKSHTYSSCQQPFWSCAEKTCWSPVYWTVCWMNGFWGLHRLHPQDGPGSPKVSSVTSLL